MRIEQIHSVQNWLPYDKIIEKGIIKMKDSSYIKIIRVNPVNYTLKSNLEKEALLNSYNNIFKSYDFNLQILIQSKKEDLEEHIKKVKKFKNYPQISKNYIEFVKEISKSRKSSEKNFYLILKENPSSENETVIINNLEENYFKIRDLLSRCGNLVSEYTEENQIIEILFSFFNSLKI